MTMHEVLHAWNDRFEGSEANINRFGGYRKSLRHHPTRSEENICLHFGGSIL